MAMDEQESSYQNKTGTLIHESKTGETGQSIWPFSWSVQDPIFPSQAGARICKPEGAKTRTPYVSWEI